MPAVRGAPAEQVDETATRQPNPSVAPRIESARQARRDAQHVGAALKRHHALPLFPLYLERRVSPASVEALGALPPQP